MLFLAACNGLLFLALAGLHGYWALGGTAGLAAALPAHPNETVVLRPSAPMVWGVAGLLLALAALAARHLWPGPLPGWLRLADAVLAAGLLLRAVGDFRYVGFSKQVRHTTFARRDTRYYSPLCLLLAGSWAALALAG